jgi:peptidoglycan-associated lipoprotein
MISQKILKTAGFVAVAALFTACQSTETAEQVEEQVTAPVVEEATAAEIAAEEARQRAEAERLAAKKALEDMKLSVDKVAYFAFDKSTLSNETKALLKKHAEILAESNDVVRLEGHADELGTREYNMALGERRAKAAMNYLVSLGVPAVRLETISYGEEKPAVLGSGEGVRAKNRRVEIVYN